MSFVLQTLCLESLDLSAFKAIHLFNVLIVVGADGIATSTSSRNFSLRVYSLLMALLAGTVYASYPMSGRIDG